MPNIAMPTLDWAIEMQIVSVSGMGSRVALTGTPVTMAISGTCNVEIGTAPQVPPSSTREMSTAVISPAAPAIIGGRPSSPEHWIQPDPTMITLGNQWLFTPPKPPIPAPATWGGPPSLVRAGPALYQWMAEDATSVSGGWVEAWNPRTGGPAFVSYYPFRPKLSNRVVTGAGGKQISYGKVLYFRNTWVEHMWADFNVINEPFTWIFVCGIQEYPFNGFTHHLLDAGIGFGKPTGFDESMVRNNVYPRNEYLGYRNHFGVLATHIQGLANDGSPIVSVDNAPTLQPRMFTVVFGAGTVAVGVNGYSYKRYQSGPNGNPQHRHFLMGRGQGAIDRNRSCYMFMLEARYFNKALTSQEIDAQYKQVAGYYRINDYNI